jgi:hypothetical protein
MHNTKNWSIELNESVLLEASDKEDEIVSFKYLESILPPLNSIFFLKTNPSIFLGLTTKI